MDKGLKEKIISVIEENATNLANGNLGENFIRLNPQIFEKVGFQAFSFAPLKVTLESPYIKSKHKTTDFDGRDVDGLVICYEDGEHSFDIAKFDKEKNQWVLTDEMKEAGITTDDLPSISGIPTTEKVNEIAQPQLQPQKEVQEQTKKDVKKAPEKTQPKIHKQNTGLLQQHRHTKQEKAMEWLKNEKNITSLAEGRFPHGCELYNFDNYFFRKNNNPLTTDGTELRVEGCTIARLNHRMNCWVLGMGLTGGMVIPPEQLPSINGQPTITYQQYAYMQHYVQPQFELRKEPDKAVSPYVMQRYNAIPESVMDVLKAMDKHPTEREIQDFCREKGDNKSLNGNGKIPASFYDLIICTFGENITRMTELEYVPGTEKPMTDISTKNETKPISHENNDDIGDR